MADGKNNYKDTLNLPKTGFDMRAGLLTKEPALQAKFEIIVKTFLYRPPLVCQPGIVGPLFFFHTIARSFPCIRPGFPGLKAQMSNRNF